MLYLYIIISLISIIIGILIHVYITNSKNNKINSFYKMNSFYKEARIILDEVRMNTKLINALLLHAHNSGDKMHANTFNKSSVLEESAESVEVSAIQDWKNKPIDRFYRNLLARVDDEKLVRLKIDEMAGDLVEYYHLYGIKGSLVFKIYDKTKASFFYASFVSSIEIDEIRFHKDYARVLIAVQKLKELCERYHKQGILK